MSRRQSRDNGADRPRTAAGGSTRRGLRGRLLVVIVSTAIALLGAEAGLRIFGVKPERLLPAKFLVWDGSSFVDRGRTAPGLIKTASRFQRLGVEMGEYVPGARFKMQYPTNPRGYFDADGTVPFSINALGMRGPAVTEAKPPGTFRIVGVGDSFTFGEGVREEDTFLRRLEAGLNKSTGRPVFQVLNTAVSGYNTRDEILTLEMRWLSLEPDLVLIGFYLNDAYSDAAFLNRGQELAASLEPTGLAKVSVIADLVQHAWRARQTRRGLDEYYQRHYFTDPEGVLETPGAEREYDWAGARFALGRAADLSKEKGFKIALVIFPEFRQLDGSYPFEKIHALVRRTCDGLSIPVLDLFDTYRGHDAATLWVHRIDHHPNEIAHRMAAEALDRFLVERHLVPRLGASPGR